MLTEEEWARIKAKWIAEGRMKDDEGYYHFTKEVEAIYDEFSALGAEISGYSYI